MVIRVLVVAEQKVLANDCRPLHTMHTIFSKAQFALGEVKTHWKKKVDGISTLPTVGGTK